MVIDSQALATIVKLQPAALTQLEALLKENRLPVDDCADQLQTFHGIYADDKLIAAGGLEPAGDYALLRSIVVHPAHRSQGLARSLTEFLISRAKNRGIQALYLLTVSAESYFTNFGFSQVERACAPASIVATRQFASLCPENASLMELGLRQA